jgi:general secretion pathway protein E
MSAVVERAVADNRLPFTFARRHGVLVRGIEGGVADCVYRAPASPVALAEARRFLRVPVKLTAVDSEAFDELLRKT